MGRQRMVWASLNDWLAVLADISPEDEYSCMTCRDVWTRPELIAAMLETDPGEIMSSWAWLDEHGRPMSIVGLSWIGYMRGEAEAWSYSTPALRARGNALSYTRACRRMVESMLSTGVARRIFADSWVGHPTSARWLKAMGFEYEGLRRSYGVRGDDFRLFSRIA